MAELREKVKTGAEQLRLKTMRELEKIFDLASALAGGQFKTQTEDGKTEKITLREKKRWLLVASKAALAIKSVATGFDENRINDDLKELEQLVKQARTKNRYKAASTSTIDTQKGSDAGEEKCVFLSEKPTASQPLRSKATNFQDKPYRTHTQDAPQSLLAAY